MARRDLTSETAPDTFDVEREARRRGLEPYQVRAMRAVSDQLIRAVVSDAYKGISQSASMIPPDRGPAKPRGTGWQEAAPMQSPPGIDHIDRIVEAQTRADRAAAIRQRIESDWIESHFDKGPRVESEWNPFDAKNMKK